MSALDWSQASGELEYTMSQSLYAWYFKTNKLLYIGNRSLSAMKKPFFTNINELSLKLLSLDIDISDGYAVNHYQDIHWCVSENLQWMSMNQKLQV